MEEDSRERMRVQYNVPKNLEIVKQQSGGWRVNLSKGGQLPAGLKGLYLTELDTYQAISRQYSKRKAKKV